ncbi:hypothetical protein DPEC_G00110090 [Dallia pectoralis]|uniref:Uncharacterized protein n=1 Tax=Dallia pectoralis TaxID=75939 RepID=A0ACC2GTG6_DALPE|nr:hypothetical protein DPEC_G00110090 [Dallia pectoralis]
MIPGLVGAQPRELLLLTDPQHTGVITQSSLEQLNPTSLHFALGREKPSTGGQKGDSEETQAAFTKDLNQRREKINLEWLKVATALEPRFKDIKCLPRAEREPVWAKLRELVKGEEPALQPLREESPEPPKKKTALLLMGSDSDEETPEDNTVERYKVEPSVSLDQCPLKWWSEHTAVYAPVRGKCVQQGKAPYPIRGRDKG